MSEFDSIEEELKFMADCSDDRGDSETSLMFVRYLAHIRKLNAELAALKAGQGEAVATISWQQPSCEWTLNMLCEPAVGEGIDVPLYFAPRASADAVSVPVELLERIVEHLEYDAIGSPSEAIAGDLAKELRALLARSESEGVKS